VAFYPGAFYPGAFCPVAFCADTSDTCYRPRVKYRQQYYTPPIQILCLPVSCQFVVVECRLVSLCFLLSHRRLVDLSARRTIRLPEGRNEVFVADFNNFYRASTHWREILI